MQGTSIKPKWINLGLWDRGTMRLINIMYFLLTATIGSYSPKVSYSQSHYQNYNILCKYFFAKHYFIIIFKFIVEQTSCCLSERTFSNELLIIIFVNTVSIKRFLRI